VATVAVVAEAVKTLKFFIRFKKAPEKIRTQAGLEKAIRMFIRLAPILNMTQTRRFHSIT